MTRPEENERDDRPVIIHREDNLPAATDQTIAAVAKLGDAGCFVFANRLHRIYVSEKVEDGDVRRPAGAVRLHLVDATHFAEVATRAAVHKKWDRRAGEDTEENHRKINCPRRVAETGLSRGDWPGLPTLHGIVEAPTVTPSGRLIDRPGYDKKSGVFLTSRPEKYVPPKAITFAAARAAVSTLHGLLSSFPFVKDEDRTAMVAAVITVLIRRLLPSAPLIAITAPAPGTGKSLLTDILSLIAVGRQAAMMSLGSDDNELEKRLYSVLGMGEVLIGLDNITGPLRSSLLCQASTQPTVQYRPLGHSMMISVPTNTCIVANGNNLVVSGDLPSRTMLIRLDAKTERPDTRHFERDILDHVLKNRGALISAALTIPLAYLKDGALHVGIRSCRFRDWDRMVRSALVWAGEPDALAPADAIRESDPDHEDKVALFSAWSATFPGCGSTVTEAVGEARRSRERQDGDFEPLYPALRDAIRSAIGDKMETKQLAGWLRRHRDQRVVVESEGGIKIELQLYKKEDKHLKQGVWIVRQPPVAG